MGLKIAMLAVNLLGQLYVEPTNAPPAAPAAVKSAPAVASAAVQGVSAVTNAPAVAKVPTAKAAKRPARITAATTRYDRKEGVAVLDRDVWVDDEQYQLHADRAYIFLDGTNDVKELVALGNVAITNEQRRAYGVKAKYFRAANLVVLYGTTNALAEVRDEQPGGEARTVRGTKIKFWVDSEQVEVTGAEISAPVTGMDADRLKELSPGRRDRH